MEVIKSTWNKVTPNRVKEIYVKALNKGSTKRAALRLVKRKCNIPNDK